MPSTSLATVENIGPSSEASAALQSCSRRLTVFSGISANFNFFHCLAQNSDKEGGGNETEESADEARRYVVS